jgi:transcriptional regulator with XRE-family HTH domain
MIGKQLKLRRKELHITQETLSALSGVSKNTIYQIERQQYNPTIEIIQKLSDVLGMRLILEVKK